MEEIRSNIDLTKVPEHIAVIMDGNGRWAKKQGIKRVFGHQNAIEAVRSITEGCAELGVHYLTLFAFSTENWNRPKAEVDALMALLVNTIKGELPTLQENNIKLSAIGLINSLPESAQVTLKQAIAETCDNEGMELILALNYSGKWDLLQAFNKLNGTTRELTPLDIEQSLCTFDLPDPDLLIRTSGEMRISNFMLWQTAYTCLLYTSPSPRDA